MKLWEVSRFEVGYQLRRGATWLCLAALSFLVATGMLVEEAERAGDVHVNAPIAVAVASVIIS